MIPVTKPYMPSRERLDKYLDGIFEREWLTNNGELVQQLTRRLEDYLGVENLLLVANGTLALQISYRALDVNTSTSFLQPEAITTPFSFIATASSLKWDGVKPVFADIDPETWCLNPERIVEKITQNTTAIVPVHVFGNACDLGEIDTIANMHNLKVIYDASHAFGVKYNGESILKYGDAATLSFHATKLFHTGEGGAIIFKHKYHFERAKMMINFGITGPECIDELGINAKMSELQAAMGLSVLDEIESNFRLRQVIWNYYALELDGLVQFQKLHTNLFYNTAYFPILFETEKNLLKVANLLKSKNIHARRYFYPSLEQIDFLGSDDNQTISIDISKRILCLPIYSSLSKADQAMIIKIIKNSV